jgi:hypothetical protein
MTYKLTSDDIAAIEIFIERNASMSFEEIAASYGWKSQQSACFTSGALRKIGVDFPRKMRARIDFMKEMKAELAELHAWKAAQEKLQ